MRCRRWYLPAEADDTPTEEEARSLEHEAAAAMWWADKMASAPGATPPLAVLSALRMATDIKSKFSDMQEKRALLDAMQAIDAAVREIAAVLAEAELSDDVRQTIAIRIRQAAERFAAGADTAAGGRPGRAAKGRGGRG
jgi:hypothetical protein